MKECCRNCGWCKDKTGYLLCKFKERTTWEDECCYSWKPKKEPYNAERVMNEWIEKK